MKSSHQKAIHYNVFDLAHKIAESKYGGLMGFQSMPQGFVGWYGIPDLLTLTSWIDYEGPVFPSIKELMTEMSVRPEDFDITPMRQEELFFLEKGARFLLNGNYYVVQIPSSFKMNCENGELICHVDGSTSRLNRDTVSVLNSDRKVVELHYKTNVLALGS